jgi:TonB family protein
MKKIITPMLIILMLLITSCSYNFEVSEDSNYIPPAIKIQPRLIYPKIAQENAYSGFIKLYLQISSEGNVEKVSLLKSSGYELLDEATINYCKRLIFFPGIEDGKPIKSRIQWDIQYNLLDQIKTVDNYLAEIKELYKRIFQFSDPDRNIVEKEILQKYSQLVGQTSDGGYFNNTITQIISQHLTDEWQQNWNSFPLTFLLYQDFIERFKDYSDITTVKILLKNSLLQDVQYIKETQTYDNYSKTNRDILLRKIRQFVSANYPEINIDGIGSSINEGIERIAKL